MTPEEENHFYAQPENQEPQGPPHRRTHLDHLKEIRTERGSTHLPPIKTHDDGEVRVYESSLATEPAIWLSVNGEADQLSTEAAWELADQIRDLVVGHYQGTKNAVPEWVEVAEVERVRNRMKQAAGVQVDPGNA